MDSDLSIQFHEDPQTDGEPSIQFVEEEISEYPAATHNASRLSEDAIGVIVSFASESVPQCLALCRVSTRWLNAVCFSPALWEPGGLLREYQWPVGNRIPMVLQWHEEVDGDATIKLRAGNPRNCEAPREMVMEGMPELQRIPASFLARRDTIVSLRLSELPSLKSLGNCFMTGCTALVDVDLSGAQTLEAIGDGFLSNCASLKSIDLSNMGAVTTIGNNFAAGCPALTTVNLAGMAAVATIASDFLWGSPYLMTVDLSGMAAVTSIGDYFLYGCRHLCFVHFTGMAAVQSIGKNFLKNCEPSIALETSGCSKHLLLFCSAHRASPTLPQVPLD